MIDPSWPESTQVDPISPELTQVDPSWPKMTQVDPNWPKLTRVDLKLWKSKHGEIDLNFCAVGLQEAVAGAFEPVNECYCISGIFLEKNVSGQHNYYKQLNINLHLKFSLDQFSSCSKNISSSIFCFSTLSFLVIPRHSHKPMSWRFFIHKKVKTFTFLKWFFPTFWNSGFEVGIWQDFVV